jgi:hypothetical protein
VILLNSTMRLGRADLASYSNTPSRASTTRPRQPASAAASATTPTLPAPTGPAQAPPTTQLNLTPAQRPPVGDMQAVQTATASINSRIQRLETAMTNAVRMQRDSQANLESEIQRHVLTAFKTQIMPTLSSVITNTIQSALAGITLGNNAQPQLPAAPLHPHTQPTYPSTSTGQTTQMTHQSELALTGSNFATPPNPTHALPAQTPTQQDYDSLLQSLASPPNEAVPHVPTDGRSS